MPWPSPRPGPSMVVRQWSQSVHRSPYPCYGCLVESSMLGPIRMLSLGSLIRINLIVLAHCVAIFGVEYFGQSGQSGCLDRTRTTPREVGVRCTVPPIISFSVAAASAWCVDSPVRGLARTVSDGLSSILVRDLDTQSQHRIRRAKE